MVGELDAGDPHVQFDEGAQETCDIAARLCPTLPQPLAIFSQFEKYEVSMRLIAKTLLLSTRIPLRLDYSWADIPVAGS